MSDFEKQLWADILRQLLSMGGTVDEAIVGAGKAVAALRTAV